MKTIRLGYKIIQTLVKDRVYYPNQLIFETISIIARFGILLLLYHYVFRLKNGVINGTTFEVIAWSMFFYFAFLVFRLRDIFRTIMQDVQSGNIEVLFSKPISYLAYRMWWQVGTGLYQFLVIAVVGGLTLALVVGLPSTMSAGLFIPTLIVAILLGGLLLLLTYTVVGLLAFWIEDVNPVYWIVDRAVMILGGSFLPIALFPDFMYKIALWSPFGASQFVTHTVYETWATEWLFKIGIQVFWVFVMTIVVAILFSKAREKVSVNGG